MKLQILLPNGEWQYVFCRNDARVVVTLERRKALAACALAYFQRHFANHQFRLAD